MRFCLRDARALAAVFGVALAAVGCEGPTDCGLRPCEPNIVVHVEGLEEAGALDAMLLVEGEDPHRLHCSSNTECVVEFHGDAFRPEDFTVTIEADDTTHSRSFSPPYRTYQPNGASCGPTCRQATVTFTVE